MTDDRFSAPKADALPGCATPRPAKTLRFLAPEPLDDSGLAGKPRQNTAGTGDGTPELFPNRMTAAAAAARGLEDRIVYAVGGVEQFSRNWSWRSHSPKQRAESAIQGAVETIGDGVTALAERAATPEQIEEWTAKAISLWLAYQSAGARTANPMITGPANFPVARNEKAMSAERKRGEEFYLFAQRPFSWLDRQTRRAEKAALSAEAATVEHRTIEFDGVKLVQNTTLDRIQLLFDGKPEAEVITKLKREAFRWSPREGAWQRQNTNNGVQAAYRVLRSLGHGTAPNPNQGPPT